MSQAIDQVIQAESEATQNRALEDHDIKEKQIGRKYSDDGSASEGPGL